MPASPLRVLLHTSRSALTRRGLLATAGGGMLALAIPGRAMPPPESLRFGVFPYLPPLALDRLFAPVLTSLTEALHRPVLMRTKATFEEFQAAIDAQEYAIAFVHPFLAVRAIDYCGFRPMVRLDAPFTLAFLTRADRRLTSLHDLRGQTVATPPSLSAAAMLAEITLEGSGLQAGIDYQPDPTPSKMSCLHKVLRADAAACTVPMFAVRQLGIDRDPRIAIVHRASLPVGLSIVVGDRLDEPTATRLIDEICTWSHTAAGREILRHAGWPGFVVADDADYDPVRRAMSQRQVAGDRH